MYEPARQQGQAPAIKRRQHGCQMKLDRQRRRGDQGEVYFAGAVK
jgi:hypothetical protein